MHSEQRTFPHCTQPHFTALPLAAHCLSGFNKANMEPFNKDYVNPRYHDGSIPSLTRAQQQKLAGDSAARMALGRDFYNNPFLTSTAFFMQVHQLAGIVFLCQLHGLQYTDVRVTDCSSVAVRVTGCSSVAVRAQELPDHLLPFWASPTISPRLPPPPLLPRLADKKCLTSSSTPNRAF